MKSIDQTADRALVPGTTRGTSFLGWTTFTDLYPRLANLQAEDLKIIAAPASRACVKNINTWFTVS